MQMQLYYLSMYTNILIENKIKPGYKLVYKCYLKKRIIIVKLIY